MIKNIACSAALTATLALLALPAAHADNLTTNDPALWQQSLDGGSTWTVADSTGAYAHTFGSDTVNGLWPAGVGEDTPVDFRRDFSLVSGGVGTISIFVDDDATVSINGHVVIDDHDGRASEITGVDVGNWLQAGNNEITVSAVSTYCCGRTFVLDSDIAVSTASAVPEPASTPMWLMGGLVLVGVARRRWFS